MPHINIKHFPVQLSQEQKAKLITAFTDALVAVLGCEPRVVSIAMEPVDPALWKKQVYVPEIVNRRELLCKLPGY